MEDVMDILKNASPGMRQNMECPFCRQRVKSLVVNTDGNFKCFLCGNMGNLKDFSPAEKLPSVLTKQKILYEINAEAGRFFYQLLLNDKKAYAYVSDRGIDFKTARRFGVGFGGRERNGLASHLRRYGVTEELCLESGLVGKAKNGKLYDRFSGRIIFPIFNPEGKVAGFGGRVTDDSKPKYVNSPKTPVFDKGTILYGYDRAVKAPTDYFVICEGYMDVISLHKNGFPMACAPLGTAFSKKHAEMLKKEKDKVYVCFDNDEAGMNAKIASVKFLRMYGLEVYMVNLSPYKDPDEFLKAEKPLSFSERLRSAEDSYTFEMKLLREQNSRDEDFKKAAAYLMTGASGEDFIGYKKAYLKTSFNPEKDRETDINTACYDLFPGYGVIFEKEKP